MDPSENREGLKVLGLIPDGIAVPSATSVYRVTLPLSYLNLNTNMRCGWMTTTHAIQRLQALDARGIFDYDIIVLARRITDDPEAARGMVDALRSMGARLVYEVDDDYTGTRDMDDGKRGQHYAALADAVTVTNKHLKAVMERYTEAPIYVVPNAIQCDGFADTAREARRIWPDNLVIMLAGTKSHYDDWKVLKEVIPLLLEDYPQVRFVVGGAQPDYLTEMSDYLPAVSYGEYPAMLAQADILCAPLDPSDQFNDSKSPIKALEGWCAARQVGRHHVGGCAVVASDHVVYRSTVQNRRNGLLVKHTPEAWEQALRLVIEDLPLRKKLQVNGLKDAKKYDIAHTWRNWHRAYLDIGGTI